MPRSALLLLAVAALPSLARAETSSLIDFEIEDQFKRKHRNEDFQGHVVLVLAADRKGSAFCGRWAQGVRTSLDSQENESVRFLSVAKTTGVPFFLKGTIRGKFPKEKENWLLLDWKGRFHESYDLAPDTCNAVVFDTRGRLVHRDSGDDPNANQVDAVVQAIRASLARETTGK